MNRQREVLCIRGESSPFGTRGGAKQNLSSVVVPVLLVLVLVLLLVLVLVVEVVVPEVAFLKKSKLRKAFGLTYARRAVA